MATFIRMPKMSDTMQQGIISNWLKQVGDKVMAGDILAEVETDKAVMELEAYEEGTLLYIGVAEKEAAQVDAIIAIIGEPGEQVTDLLASAQKMPDVTSTSRKEAVDIGQSPPGEIPIVNEKENNLENPVVGLVVGESKQSHRLLVSPLAKRIAKEKGYPITQIVGSGPEGRIVKKDVVRFNPEVQNYKFDIRFEEAYEDRPPSAMRHRLAKVLTESKATIPHFYLTRSIEMDKMMALRLELNEDNRHKLSINDFMIKAIALALSEHPTVNAAWLKDKIRFYQHIHIGVAVALEEGLMVPVLRFANQKSLLVISKEMKEMGEKARAQILPSRDVMGATFTLSNLGMFGIDSFTAIVNPPAACILAIGAVHPLPIVKAQQVVIAHMLKVTLCCDHRIVDGAVGALFLSTLKELLEHPLRLLL